MSKRARKPGFVLFIDDFLGGTIAMTAAEVGDYIRLLCNLYDKGGRIEANQDQLRHIFKCRPQDVAKRLQRLIDLGKIFTDRTGLIHNGRVDREIKNIEENGVDEAAMKPKWRANEASARAEKSTKSRPRAPAPSTKPSHTFTDVNVSAHARAKKPAKNSMIEEIDRRMAALKEEPHDEGYFLLPPTRHN
jgi:uncharacterized protein YdaU (DUF1376 family)